jgi:hypothetical protein
MSSHSGQFSGVHAQTGAERAAGAFVLVVLAAACIVFWAGIPIACLWALGELTDSAATHLLTALIAIPTALVAFTPVLLWLNGLYLRVTGIQRRIELEERHSGWRPTVRGPLEPLMFACFLIAVAALLYWFFVLAENPSPRVL